MKWYILQFHKPSPYLPGKVASMPVEVVSVNEFASIDTLKRVTTYLVVQIIVQKMSKRRDIEYS